MSEIEYDSRVDNSAGGYIMGEERKYLAEDILDILEKQIICEVFAQLNFFFERRLCISSIQFSR